MTNRRFVQLLQTAHEKPQNKGEQDIQEAPGSLATGKETHVDAAVAAVSLEMGSILALKEEQTTALKAFLGKHVFALLPTSFVKSLVQQHGASRLATGHWPAAKVAPRTNRRSWTSATQLNWQ